MAATRRAKRAASIMAVVFTGQRADPARLDT
jgi:hypothetical protein